MSFIINLSTSQDGNVLFDLKIRDSESISFEKGELEFLFLAIIDLKELDYLQPVGTLTRQLLDMALHKKQNKVQRPQGHCSLFKPHHQELTT